LEIIYDNRFDLNEWAIIIMLVIGTGLIWICRKRFPVKELIVYWLFCFFMGMVFDTIISIEPFDFYDINDNSMFELMDFLTYLGYGVYGFFFVYLYDLLKIKAVHAPAYILLWALLSVFTEYIASLIGVFHYKNGYNTFYSLPTYLFVLSLQLLVYRRVHVKNAARDV
jgi:hypothetical protein